MSHSTDAASLVRRLWQYCNVLRDDGLSYPDYVEQLTYLLFLKMADESDSGPISREQGWASFAELAGPAMQQRYEEVLAQLGTREGTLGLIFRGAQNKIRDPGKLRLLVVELFGQTEWTGFSADVKGDAYEGLLEKNARDTKSGAGQYFTPRPLVDALVECVDPKPGETICDPACGTAGFLLAAHDHVAHGGNALTAAQSRHLKTRALRGVELVREVARLAAMNLYLHDVSSESNAEVPIRCADSLRDPPGSQVDVVLTNPPFGTKGTVTYASGDGRAQGVSDDLVIVRPDFWVRTANKQLNFLQHITSLLKASGRAAVVLPDNVLFESGAAASIRKRLLERSDVHTILRLPPGLFYAPGVLSNVMFFDATPAETSKRELWTYDFRSDNRFTLKSRPLRRQDLDDFVRLFKPGAIADRRVDEETSRWRRFEHDTILASDDYRLDLTWDLEAAPDDSAVTGLDRIDQIGLQIEEDLRRALEHFSRAREVGS
jgi:type I restriction enzyme M protein